MKAHDIVGLLSRSRFRLNREKATQADIEECFISHGVVFVREARLSSEDIPDFVVGRTAIEVKLRGAKREIYAQVNRYAQYDEIDDLILVTNVAMGMPPAVKGKPVYVVNLARAWL